MMFVAYFKRSFRYSLGESRETHKTGQKLYSAESTEHYSSQIQVYEIEWWVRVFTCVMTFFWGGVNFCIAGCHKSCRAKLYFYSNRLNVTHILNFIEAYKLQKKRQLYNSFDGRRFVHRNIIPNYSQQDETFLHLFIFTNALHVSGGSSAHHQEHITTYSC